MAHLEIAFNRLSGTVLEGHHSGGLPRVLDPKPFFTAAVVGTANDRQLASRLPGSVHLEAWQAVFREDYIEPLGRLRRGRLYMRGEASERRWLTNVVSGADHPFPTFESASLGNFPTRDLADLRVLLGINELHTEWRVVQLEYVETGEIQLMLRARSMLGILPELLPGAIPQTYRAKIESLSSKLAGEVGHGLPESVVELCRNLASTVLTAKNRELDPGREPKELGQESDFFEEHCTGKRRTSWFTVAHCARVIGRLHAEGKAVEQDRLALSSLTDRDAELAVNCIARMLVVLGWAN